MKCLTKEEPGDCDNFFQECFSRITKSNKQNTFIFIFEKFYDPSLIFSENIIPIVSPSANTLAGQYIWYNIKIPRLLKKYKADVFVTAEYCLLATKVPQCFILSDISFLRFPLFFNKKMLFFFKRFIPRFVIKAKKIIVHSQYAKAEIIQQYKTSADKLEVAYTGVHKNYHPVSLEERESIKEKYADGNEYFIYPGEVNPSKNLLNLLRAFSAFKKRQKSSMRLIIVSGGSIHDEKFEEGLRLFKFKKEVRVLTNVTQDEIVKVVAAAYAMVCPSFFENFGASLLNAMKSEVPIITSSAGAIPEICGDAALYADPENFKEIAVQMMLLFKDEKLRKDLIVKGKSRQKDFSWDTTAGLVWNVIQMTMVPSVI